MHVKHKGDPNTCQTQRQSCELKVSLESEYAAVFDDEKPRNLCHGDAFSMNVTLFIAALDGFSMDPGVEIEFPS